MSAIGPSGAPARRPPRGRAVRACLLAALTLAPAARGGVPVARGGAPGGRAQGVDAAVEREWRVRAWALDLAAARAELDAALAAGRPDGAPGVDGVAVFDGTGGGWTRRYAALDAIARGLAIGPDLFGTEAGRRAPDDGSTAPRDGRVASADRADAVVAWAAERTRGAAADPHPNVRAAALEALARLAPEERWGAGEDGAAALAADPYPAVRAALARALDGVGSAAAARALGALCRDPDARVSAAARASLFALAAPRDPAAVRATAVRDAIAAAQGDELVALAASGADEELLDAWRTWARAGGERRVLTDFRAWCDRAEPERGRSWRAVAAALDLALFAARPGGSGDAGDVPGAGDAADEGRLRALFDGWLGAGEWDPRRQGLLALAGSRGSDEALEAALVDALDLVDALERDAAPAAGPPPVLAGLASDVRARLGDGRESELFHLRYDLFDALARAAGPAGIAARLAERGAAPETLAFVLPEIGLRADAGAVWDAERDARWLAPERPRDVRIAAAEAFAHTLSAGTDADARALAVRALRDADPIVVRIAFRALCEVRDPPPPFDALRGAYDRAEEGERPQLLAWLPRDAPLEAFRDVLLAGAAAPPERPGEDGPLRARAVELLGTLAPDPAVAGELAAHLAEAVAALRALGAAPTAPGSPGSPDSPGSPGHAPAEDDGSQDDARARRGIELRITGLLRALAGAAPDPARTEAVLAAAVGRSPDVGKVAAAQLARGTEPERLARFLGAEVERRTRIEAAIGLAWRAQDPELERAAAARLLADVDAAAWDLRVRVLDALGATVDAAPEAARFLDAVAGDAGRAPEDRKRALEALAAAGRLAPVRAAAGAGLDAEVRMVALGLLADAGEDLEPYLEALPDERILAADRERLRLFLLRAGARRGSLTAAREAELLSGPLDAACATQAARFVGPAAAEGARLPEPEFAWRGELDALAVVARAGRLGAVLDGDALARLDGRLLLALGERALAAEAWEDARRALGAAWIALQSDVDVPDAKAQAVRCRLLGIAWTTGRHAEAARLAEALLADHRAHRIADAVWDGAFGVADPRRGVDPVARLTAFAAQARAYAALATGDRATAQTLAAQAAARVGASLHAAEEQARLEAALRR